MELTYFIVGFFLLLIALVIIGFAVYYYFDEYDERNKPENANNAKIALMTFLLVPAAILWPISVPAGILVGLFLIIRRLIASIRDVDSDTKG